MSGDYYLSRIIEKSNRDQIQIPWMHLLMDDDMCTEYHSCRTIPGAGKIKCSDHILYVISICLDILFHARSLMLQRAHFVQVGGKGKVYRVLCQLAPLYDISIQTFSVFYPSSILSRGDDNNRIRYCHLDGMKRLAKGSYLIDIESLSLMNVKERQRYIDYFETVTEHGTLIWTKQIIPHHISKQLCKNTKIQYEKDEKKKLQW